MKRYQKVVSGLVCSCMVIGSLMIPAFAAGETEGDNAVYQVRNLKTDEMVTTYQNDIETGHWNVDALGADSPVIFEEFPMRIDSRVDYYGKLNIMFEYLKELSDTDQATFSMADRDTGEIYYTADLAANSFVELSDVPMDRIFNVTLTENFDGAEAVYSRVIKTENKRAEMPLNVSLDSVGETAGMQAHSLELVELNEADEETTVDVDGNEVVVVGQRNTISILPEELPAYYDSLSADRLYKVFAGAGENETSKTFEGFISTYDGGRDYGVFMPGFSSYSEDGYAALENQVRPFAVNGSSEEPESGLTPGEVTRNALEYNYMDDREILISRESTGRDYFVVHFTCFENTPFQIETISNDDITVELWSMDKGASKPIYEYAMLGKPSVSEGYRTLAGNEIYLVIFFDGFGDGRALFRIRATEYGDQTNSYYDLLKLESEAKPARQKNNVLVTEYIDYLGDVDVYYVDNTTETGAFSMTAENKATVSNGEAMVMEVRRIATGLDGREFITRDSSHDIGTGVKKSYVFTFEAGTKYFIYFYSKYPTFSTSKDDPYQFKISLPTMGDPYEPNDSVATATAWEDVTPTKVTLHKGDVDYFTFTTNHKLYALDAGLSKVNNIAYNMSLIQLVNGVETVLAERENNSTYLPTVELEPNSRYYIKVDAEDLGNVYAASLSYRPTITLDAYSINAQLDSSVTLQGGDEATAATIEGYLDQVVQQMMVTATVYRETQTLSSAKVRQNTKLYYSNGGTKTELTADAINGLEEGEYSITAEVYGTAATGGTITLAVAGGSKPPVGDIVELNTVQVESVLNPLWDWAACAKMTANSRLSREGSPLNVTNVVNAINSAFGTAYLQKRGTLQETAQMANYLYCGDKNSYNFMESAVSIEGAENVFADALREGKAMIANLTSTDNTNSRYILVCGVNTTEHTFKIIDPTIGTAEWIPAEELYSGYRGDSSLTFTGQVIEVL